MNGMRAVFWIVAILTATSIPDTVFAWGPATHVGLAETVLRNLGILPTAIAALLSKHAVAYLYGNVAADIVFAKRLSRIKQFCHHWPTALGLLRSAPNEGTRAFAYGYLSHLAADTVAHGKFVPQLVTMSGAGINTGHLYWELRADAGQSQQTWSVLRSILGHDHDEHHDVLSGHLSDTLLSYGTNRFLFNRLNALSLNRNFRRSMSFVDRWSRWPLPPVMISGYHTECVDRMISILSELERSPVLREDPNGTRALMNLRDMRREQRRIRVPRQTALTVNETTPAPTPTRKRRENAKISGSGNQPDAETEENATKS